MRTVCMYCGETLKETNDKPDAVSHGCCVDCMDQLYAPYGCGGSLVMAYRPMDRELGDVAQRVEITLASGDDPDLDDVVMMGWRVQSA